MAQQKPLVVRNLSKTYYLAGRQVKAVDGVSFTVEEREALAFLGPNGSGKTTTINIISGLLLPDDGEVTIFGKKINEKGYFEKASLVTSSSGFFWRLTGRDIIKFYAEMYGSDPAIGHELAEKYGISDILDRKYSSYSQGQKTRLKLVVAMLKNPRLLIMDEPTVGLDPEIADEFRKSIIELKKNMSILITSHYMKDIEEIADRVCFILNGKVLKIGKLSEFKTGEEEIEIKLSKRFRGMARLKKLGNVRGLLFTTTKDRLFEALSIIGENFSSITSREIDMERYFIEVVRNAKGK